VPTVAWQQCVNSIKWLIREEPPNPARFGGIQTEPKTVAQSATVWGWCLSHAPLPNRGSSSGSNGLADEAHALAAGKCRKMQENSQCAIKCSGKAVSDSDFWFTDLRLISYDYESVWFYGYFGYLISVQSSRNWNCFPVGRAS